MKEEDEYLRRIHERLQQLHNRASRTGRDEVGSDESMSASMTLDTDYEVTLEDRLSWLSSNELAQALCFLCIKVQPRSQFQSLAQVENTPSDDYLKRDEEKRQLRSFIEGNATQGVPYADMTYARTPSSWDDILNSPSQIFEGVFDKISLPTWAASLFLEVVADIYYESAKGRTRPATPFDQLSTGDEDLDWASNYWNKHFKNDGAQHALAHQSVVPQAYKVAVNHRHLAPSVRLNLLKAAYILGFTNKYQRLYFEQSFKNALSQRKHRAKRKDRVPLNTQISARQKTQLKELAKRKDKTMYEVLEELILREYERRR